MHFYLPLIPRIYSNTVNMHVFDSAIFQHFHCSDCMHNYTVVYKLRRAFMHNHGESILRPSKCIAITDENIPWMFISIAIMHDSTLRISKCIVIMHTLVLRLPLAVNFWCIKHPENTLRISKRMHIYNEYIQRVSISIGNMHDSTLRISKCIVIMHALYLVVFVLMHIHMCIWWS